MIPSPHPSLSYSVLSTLKSLTHSGHCVHSFSGEVPHVTVGVVNQGIQGGPDLRLNGGVLLGKKEETKKRKRTNVKTKREPGDKRRNTDVSLGEIRFEICARASCYCSGQRTKPWGTGQDDKVSAGKSGRRNRQTKSTLSNRQTT